MVWRELCEYRWDELRYEQTVKVDWPKYLCAHAVMSAH